MRKSFLRILSLILACIFVVSLVGCKPSSDNETNSGTTIPDSETTIPEDETTAPEGGTTTPEGGTTTPEGGTTTPEGGTTTPEDETTIPEGGTTTPEDETTAPEGGTTTPEGGTTTPEGGTTTPEGGTTTPEGEPTTPEGGTTTPEDEPTTPVTPSKPNYVNINWKSLYDAGLMRSQWLTDIGQFQNDYTSKFTVTATETALTSTPNGKGDDRLYFSTKMYEITSDTSYEYTFEAKNDRAGYYAGVIFAYDITGKFPYLAFGEFDNRSVDGKNCIYYRRGHFDELIYDCIVNKGDFFNVKVNETNDGYGQYKVIYEGLNVKFCYRDTSGEYVQLGNTITLPAGSKVCVGVYSPVNQYIGGECCTASLRNCVLTAKNDETIDYLVGQNISLVKEFTVKVATFNICKAEYGATKYKDYTKIVAAIKASGAEIIGLQEIEYRTKRTGYVDQTAEIARLAGYPYYKFFKAFDFNEGASCLAVISKYPIENWDQINLPASGSAQRILARAGIRVHNELINFFVTHLSYNGEPGTDRAPQFTTIANKIANYNKVILVGDFNTDYWPQFNPIVNKGFLLVSKSDSDKTGTYYDETYGYLALDNIVHSKIFTASGRNFIDNGASDHRLLYATLTYRE